ncbi:MAG: hypothetical protein QOH96_1089 [Blastocatellia bacterium]|jgi:hypothetical protein|nr:hypothetical protein [Blastocatellia bacterium]
MIQQKNRIGGTILGFSLLFGFGATAATTVQAQGLNARLNLTQQDRYQQDRDQQDRYQRDRDNNRDQNRDRGRRRGRNNDGYPNLGGTFQLRQTALNAGYNEGIKEGRNDRRRNRTSDFRSYNSFRRADKDYNRRNGDKELHRRYFQMAFETGYNDGLDGN